MYSLFNALLSTIFTPLEKCSFSLFRCDIVVGVAFPPANLGILLTFTNAKQMKKKTKAGKYAPNAKSVLLILQPYRIYMKNRIVCGIVIVFVRL